jgi:choline dehydrogenase-like flavoprotein
MFKRKANRHINAIVIGAGAGGGIVAKELAAAGLSVVLFERGRWMSWEDSNNDELISQYTFPLDCSFGPEKRKNPRTVVDSNGEWRFVWPNEWAYGNTAACVGGGTLSYGAMAWRYMQEDFKLKSTYGHVEGSTVDDWPISYQDLEPFYEKAEYEIGVSGDYSNNPFGPPRKNPFPMPAFSYNLTGRILEKAALKVGFHPFPIPMLRNSVPYGGRPACIRIRRCCGFSCPVDAKCGTQNTVIPIAIETGNCELRTECRVFEMILDDTGKARGVKYFDSDDREMTQTADLIVLSCSATETARLLLNSKSKLFPDGAGNNSGWVGHNLQDHAYSGATGLFGKDTFDDIGPGAIIAISDFNHHNEGIVGGAVLTNGFTKLPYQFSNGSEPGKKNWGTEHKEFMRNFFWRNVDIHGPVQEMPVFENKVEIDPTIKDYWGIPVVRLSGYRHPNDFKVGQLIAEKAEIWLKEAGAIKIWKSIAGNRGGASQHQAGTCRMGDDPKTSVTNKYGQLHEIDNIFVADGSLQVTNGGFNPVLTIMALAYWVSDYIKKEWNGTKFR